MNLTLEYLSDDRLPEAYPLVRSGTRTTQAHWEQFARRLIARGGAILAVTAPDGCVHGVAAFRPCPDRRYRQRLDVDVFVAFELSGGGHVSGCLEAGIRQAASDRGFSEVRFARRALPGATAGSRSPARRRPPSRRAI